MNTRAYFDVLEFTWSVTDQSTLSGFSSWLDAEFEVFASSDPRKILGATVVEDLAGNRLRQSPEWSYKLRGEYDFALGNGGIVTLGAEASYKGTQFFTEFNRQILGLDSYTLLDINIKYISPDERFTVNVWGKNIDDEFARSSMFASGGGRVITEALLAPATEGITVGYRF